ncbi:ABC transporter substrate-binding protein [Bauldia sp.]|uniref:ABC transporter substrate-binding protein n=1 Tax=Bauldia sp. TaxID=2575872 RepID=UPI003BA8D13D
MKKLAIAALALVIAAPAAAEEITIGVASHRKVLDPRRDTSNAATGMFYAIYESLIERDPFTPGKYLPGLATEWTMIDDTTMELKLREGVTFHNGDTMDAYDVEASLDPIFKLEDPRYRNPHGKLFYNFEEVEVVDDMTVRIHTKRPDALIETLLSSRNAGIRSLDQINDGDEDRHGLMPIGAGPYKVVSFDPNVSLVVERFDAYWGEPAPFDKVTFLRIPEVSNRITALVNGEADIVSEIPPDQYPLIDAEDGLKRVEVAYPMFHVWLFNNSHPVTSDVKLRQALTLAIDYDGLAEGLWRGHGVASAAWQFPQVGETYNPDLDIFNFDPERARALLAESNYDGEEIEVAIYPGYYLYGQFAAQAIQEMWADVGANMKIKLVEVGGLTLDTDPQTMVRNWSIPMYYSDIMGVMDTSLSESAWAVSRGYFDPEADPRWLEYYEVARFGQSVEERKEAYAKLHEVFTDIAPVIPLYQPADSYAMRADIDFAIPSSLRPFTVPLRAGQITFGE